MNFPNFLRLIVMPYVEQIKINSTTTIQKITMNPVEIELASLLAKRYKFSYELVQPSDGEVGRQLPNGNWTGMAGMLLRNEGDLVNSILTITVERMKFLDFSFPSSREQVTFVTSKPEYSSDTMAFLKPFSADLWISLVAFLIIMPAIFETFLKRRYTYGKLLLATFQSLLSQPMGIRPQNTKEYFLIFFYITGSAYLIHGYTCTLLSFMTFPTFTGVRTIPELAAAVAAGKYQCVSYPGTFIGTALASSNDPNFRIIGRNLQQNEGSSDVLDVLRRSKDKRKSAFVGAIGTLVPFKATYFISQDEFFPIFTAVGMRKDFCCREQVTLSVLQISSFGIFQKETEHYRFRQSLKHIYENSEVNDDRRVRQLSLADIEGALFVLCIGWALSVVMFIFETIFHRFSKNSKRSLDLGLILTKRTKFKH